jgi:hypothetical protein
MVNVINVVTAGAAGLAAVLAAVNLYITGHRELRRWTRDALVDTLVAFLDVSFKLNSASKDFASNPSCTDITTRPTREAIVTAHNSATEILTRLRLLAPAKVVKTAEALH